MGNCNFAIDKLEEGQSINKTHFKFLSVIGKGGFGRVWKVERKKFNTTYAIKEMSKCKIVQKKSVSSIMSEKKLLSQLKHPFLINMFYAFQDYENLYLVTDLVTGGDLRYHICKNKKFSEEQTKFFVACCLIGLEYMHSNGVIHRDIKPENLLMDSNGYLRITDLGISREWSPDNSQETSGTPGYMAPEVMCRQNHGVAVDYFAIGVITYELMKGKRPYAGKNRKEIRDQIFSKQICLRKSDLPDGWSMEAADFINKTLQRKPSNRLGLNGPEEIKSHIWLKDVDWQAIEEKKFESPFKPDIRPPLTNPKIEKETPEQLEENSIMLRRNSIQSLFNGYEYDIEQLRHAMIQEKRKTKLKDMMKNQNNQQINQSTSQHQHSMSQSIVNTNLISNKFQSQQSIHLKKRLTPTNSKEPDFYNIAQ